VIEEVCWPFGGGIGKGEIVGLIDEAIALEERAEMNYRSAAETTTDVSAATVLRLLADEEASHANALRTMNVGGLEAGSSLIDAGKDWIGGQIEGGVGSISTDAGLLDVLRRAMEIERTTEAFYRERGAASDQDEIRVLFERLARIEKGHYLFVSTLVEYYDRPNEWVESAEFGLRPEY
jgi:rubrerythrin